MHFFAFFLLNLRYYCKIMHLVLPLNKGSDDNADGRTASENQRTH